MQIEQAAGGSVIKHWKLSDVERCLIPRLDASLELEIGKLADERHELRRSAERLLREATENIDQAIVSGQSWKTGN